MTYIQRYFHTLVICVDECIGTRQYYARVNPAKTMKNRQLCGATLIGLLTHLSRAFYGEWTMSGTRASDTVEVHSWQN